MSLAVVEKREEEPSKPPSLPPPPQGEEVQVLGKKKRRKKNEGGEEKQRDEGRKEEEKASAAPFQERVEFPTWLVDLLDEGDHFKYISQARVLQILKEQEQEFTPTRPDDEFQEHANTQVISIKLAAAKYVQEHHLRSYNVLYQPQQH